MKVRIKKVTDGYGTSTYYPQRRVFGVWRGFPRCPSSAHSVYFFNAADCRYFLDMKLMAKELKHAQRTVKITYLTHP